MGDRGTSAVVSYVLVLGIVALLASGLVTGFAPFVVNQQHDAAHSTLEVFGNDIAGDIDSADRLAAKAGDDGTVELRTRLPDRVGGSPYEIELVNVTDGGEHSLYDYEIELRSADPETTARVRVRSHRPIEGESDVLDGGILKIELVHEGDETKLVIRNV